MCIRDSPRCPVFLVPQLRARKLQLGLGNLAALPQKWDHEFWRAGDAIQVGGLQADMGAAAANARLHARLISPRCIRVPIEHLAHACSSHPIAHAHATCPTHVEQPSVHSDVIAMTG